VRRRRRAARAATHERATGARPPPRSRLGGPPLHRAAPEAGLTKSTHASERLWCATGGRAAQARFRERCARGLSACQAGGCLGCACLMRTCPGGRAVGIQAAGCWPRRQKVKQAAVTDELDSLRCTIVALRATKARQEVRCPRAWSWATRICLCPPQPLQKLHSVASHIGSDDNQNTQCTSCGIACLGLAILCMHACMARGSD